jgi:hypothetical protein
MRSPASENDFENVRSTTTFRMARHERHRALAREVDVGLVDDQHAVEPPRELLDGGVRHQRPRRRVRIAEERQPRAVVASSPRQREVARPRHADARAALHRDERLVEAVRRHRERDAVPGVDDRAHEEREALVRAVAGET